MTHHHQLSASCCHAATLLVPQGKWSWMERPSHPSECYHMQWNPWRPDDLGDLGPGLGEISLNKRGGSLNYIHLLKDQIMKMYGKILGLGFLIKFSANQGTKQEKSTSSWNFPSWYEMESMAKTTLPREIPHVSPIQSPALLSRRFWVDDFLNFPFGGYVSSLEGSMGHFMLWKFRLELEVKRRHPSPRV